MPRETSSRSCSVIEGCLPTWESDPVATEAVAPILYTLALWPSGTLAPWHPGYTLALTNRLGGCLVTLCSWGAHRSSAHTPVSRSSSRPISSAVTASLCSATTSVGEQAYSDHFGGHRATGQSNGRDGTEHTLRRFGLSPLKEPDRGDNKTLVMTHMSGATQFNRVKEEHTGCFLFLYEDKESSKRIH